MKRQERVEGTMVFATDFLKPAQRAFSYALTLARALQLRLVILHAIKGVTDARSLLPPDSRYIKPLKTAALLELGRLTHLAQEAGVRAEPRLQVGHPAGCLLEATQGLHARMIVMGTHGRTGWDRLQLGSTAEAVIREAPCPVMTVRGVIAGEVTRSHRHTWMTRLLVTTDFSATAQEAVRYAVRLASQLKATLLVLHVVDPSECGNESGGHQPVGVEVLRASRAHRLSRVLSRLVAKDVTAEGACAVGIPIEVILEQAAKWNADAIVIGTHGRRGLRRLVLGSLAEQVVRRAGCPVLTVNRSAGRVLL